MRYYSCNTNVCNFQSYTSTKAAPQIKPGGARASVRGLPRLESTPIVGERGLLLNLSPIVKQPSADDTAVLDNKENHLVSFCSSLPFLLLVSLLPFPFLCFVVSWNKLSLIITFFHHSFTRWRTLMELLSKRAEVYSL